MGVKNNNITHVRLLYGLFGGILLISLGLFFSHIFYPEEMSLVGELKAFNSDYAFTVTDLRSSSPLYAVEHPVEGMPEGISAHAHVNRFDIDCYTDNAVIVADPRLHWASALQLFSVAALLAVVVLVVVALISFYRSAKQGRIFPRKSVILLLVIGLLWWQCRSASTPRPILNAVWRTTSLSAPSGSRRHATPSILHAFSLALR